MKIFKKLSALFLTLTLIFSPNISAFAKENPANYTENAVTTDESYTYATLEYSGEDTEYFSIPISNPQSRGSFYKLDVSLTGNKATRTVSATVKNTAALGFSTINISITLYSDRVGTPYARATKHDNDLNLGESLTVSHVGVKQTAKYYAVVSGVANDQKINYSTNHIPFNRKGEKYPTQLRSPVTGSSLPYNIPVTLNKVPVEKRVAWTTSIRNAYAKRHGYDLTGYQVHHIVPRAYGGNNADSNLIPLRPSDHTIVTNWWANY